jgi:serine phosphatase RsbU (regulator of sigma subunit)
MAEMTDAKEKKLLLLVDDTPANIQVANSILKEDYKIRVATSGEKALELVNAKPMPDLILLDVMMPEMDGYEVCSRLKDNKETRDIPVIFLTGQTDADDETKGFQVGAVDYIHKPFSPSVVKARVHTHIMLRDAHRQLAQQLWHINHELEMARRIQLAILPSEIPKTNGLEIAVRYLPMTAVAGDFYDFIVVDDKHVGILVADVSGHGLAAALIASMLQVSLAAQSAHASDPGRVLVGLNHALCGKFQHHFVTAAYVFIDMEKNLISYAGAAHPPLLVWQRSTRSAVDLMENGLLLGHFPDEVYSTVCFPVESGDRCVLYTDAILETMNSSQEQFGTDRFLRFIENNQELAADPFADSLLSELSRWSGYSQGQGQTDDITLLTIDFRRH